MASFIGPEDLDARLIFTMWKGEYFLQHERDEIWRSEAASLRIVSELLEEEPKRQWTADWLVNPRNNANLYLDGFFPNSRWKQRSNIRAHSISNRWSGSGGIGAFQAVQRYRDEVKAELLKEHGISLRLVRHDEVSRPQIERLLRLKARVRDI